MESCGIRDMYVHKYTYITMTIVPGTADYLAGGGITLRTGRVDEDCVVGEAYNTECIFYP